MPHSANLLAEYSGQAGMARRPHIDDTFTMTGSFPLVRCGIASRISSTGAKKLTSITWRITDSSELAKCPQLGEAGVVDEDVDAAEFLDGGGNESLAIGGDSQIGRHGE